MNRIKLNAEIQIVFCQCFQVKMLKVFESDKKIFEYILFLEEYANSQYSSFG